VNDGFVSCSLSISGSSNSQREFKASFLEVDGSALSNPRQLIHWWTSTAQYGAASIPAISSPVYLITTGSQVVANTTGSINHAVTNTSGIFAVRITTPADLGTTTVWFNTEVQGIIYSISTTLFTSPS
jgi:hypothetical protein